MSTLSAVVWGFARTSRPPACQQVGSGAVRGRGDSPGHGRLPEPHRTRRAACWAQTGSRPL